MNSDGANQCALSVLLRDSLVVIEFLILGEFWGKLGQLQS